MRELHRGLHLSLLRVARDVTSYRSFSDMYSTLRCFAFVPLSQGSFQCVIAELRVLVVTDDCRALFIIFIAFLNFALTDAGSLGTITGMLLL